MGKFVNIFPVLRYPTQIKIKRKLYTPGEKFLADDKTPNYRIDNYVYFPEDEPKESGSMIEVVSLSIDELSDQKHFCKLLRRFILIALKNSCISSKYEVHDEKWRLKVIARQPILCPPDLQLVEVYEGIEIRTHHWKVKNFGIIVDYFTTRKFSLKFKKQYSSQISLPEYPSYHDIHKFIPHSIDAQKTIRCERCIRGESTREGKRDPKVLNNRIQKIKGILKDAFNWNEGETKEFLIPLINSRIFICNEMMEVKTLGNEIGY